MGLGRTQRWYVSEREEREPQGRRFETPLNIISASLEDQCLVIFFFSYLEILLHLHKLQIGQDRDSF